MKIAKILIRLAVIFLFAWTINQDMQTEKIMNLIGSEKIIAEIDSLENLSFKNIIGEKQYDFKIKYVASHDLNSANLSIQTSLQTCPKKLLKKVFSGKRLNTADSTLIKKNKKELSWSLSAKRESLEDQYFSILNKNNEANKNIEKQYRRYLAYYTAMYAEILLIEVGDEVVCLEDELKQAIKLCPTETRIYPALVNVLEKSGADEQEIMHYKQMWFVLEFEKGNNLKKLRRELLNHCS